MTRDLYSNDVETAAQLARGCADIAEPDRPTPDEYRDDHRRERGFVLRPGRPINLADFHPIPPARKATR